MKILWQFVERNQVYRVIENNDGVICCNCPICVNDGVCWRRQKKIDDAPPRYTGPKIDLDERRLPGRENAFKILKEKRLEWEAKIRESKHPLISSTVSS